MAGKTLVLEQGQILFNKGDHSDGMYLVRSGELIVFFEENGKEVVLSEVKMGGMIGEMALFENKPRSAAVKALKHSELTLISQDDFTKLMKQIPKWFTAVMVTLSSRLRLTNERLQVLERLAGDASKVNKIPKILSIFDLLLHKESMKQEKEAAKGDKEETKAEKEWVIAKNVVLEYLAKWFFEDSVAMEKLFNALAELNYLQLKGKDDNQTLVVTSRGILLNFITFLNSYLLQDKKAVLSSSAMDILTAANVIGAESAYDPVTISYTDFQSHRVKHGFKEAIHWQTAIEEFKDLHREIQLIKASDGVAGLRATKKDLKLYAGYHAALYKLSKALLS